MAKVVFQTIAPHLLRATSIGYLYEIARKHRVVLLTREVDAYTKKILADRNMFPGLEKIVVFEWPFEGRVLLKNYRARKLVKAVIREYAPDIVIAQTDIWPPDTYLMRFAKQKRISTVVMQSGFKIAEQKKLYLWSCLTNAHANFPGFLPFPVRLFLAKGKKYAGHFFYYWILPVTAGAAPFWGRASFVFWHESWGLRDADYSVVFSKRDYEICRKDGVKPEKLFVLGHPLEHESTRRFFEDTYFSQSKKKLSSAQGHRKVLTIMWPSEQIGFREGDYSLISEEEMRKNRAALVAMISGKLPDWKIFIKPHPAVKHASEVRELLGQVPDNVVIVEPSEPADGYIEKSSVIVGLPPSSTTLFTAQKQNPNTIVISLNLNNELLGDSYKDFAGIEYIDTHERFTRMIDTIRSGIYAKKHAIASQADFLDAGEFINWVYAQRLS